VIYRNLEREEMDRLKEVDRSEVIEHIYYFRKGRLELEKEHWEIHGWDPGHYQSCVKALYHTYDTGGFVFGAFEEEKLVGVASLEKEWIGRDKNYLKLDRLYVSSACRKLGIGKSLMKIAAGKAKELGAKKLYVSATPSENTVGFYMGIGCRLTEELIPELFELEPEDIHLELVL
jgi:GNAT superfamily N-acetyltransferase